MSYFREPFNGLSHLAAAVISIFGTALLVAATWEEPGKRISLAVYGATLTLMLSASAAYHSIRCDKPRLKRLRKIDHATIYALIAGTYTPFTLVSLRGPWGWSLFGTIWGLAVLGVVLKVTRSGKIAGISTAIYLAMGWIVVVAFKPLLASVDPGGLILLLAGGLAYSAGVIFYAWQRLPYNHAIWHLFVLVGSLCHFFAILFYVIPLA